MNKKNVLLIYTDQQRKDTLGCYGNDKVITPNIDRLADNGICFDNYYVTNPVCAPSRASFLSGRYPSEINIGDNGHVMPEDIKTINDYFSQSGYKTANIGKLHFLPHCNRTHAAGEHPSYGFDVIINSDEPGCYNDDYIRWVEKKDKTQVTNVRCGLPTEAKNYGHVEYIKRGRSPHQPYIFDAPDYLSHSSFVTELTNEFVNECEEPFFAIAGFYAPHAPINPNKIDLEKFADIEFDLPIFDENENSFLPPFNRDLSHMSVDDWKKVVKYYHALTHHVDNCVGQLIDNLKKSGKYEDTIIIFTTDHGEFLGDHGRVHKGMPGHEVIANVPMIISNIDHSIKRSDAMFSAVDFIPTLLDIVGIEDDNNLKGKSLLPVIKNEIKDVRENVILQYFNETYQATTIVSKKYKLYVDNEDRLILFDLEKNKHETIDYSTHPDYKDILNDMLIKLSLYIMDITYSKNKKIAPY